MGFRKTDITSATSHLSRRDKVIRKVIKAVGPFTLRLERNRFRMLVRSIISQQISTGAARSIREKLDALVDGNVTADTISSLNDDQLRSAGLSPQKTRYLHDLSSCVNNGEIRLRTIGRRSDESVIEELVQIKGVGRWTAQMFLMFSLGRLDVLPYDDLGIKSAIRNLYGLDDLPDRQKVEAIADPWRPYASIASWYCWRSLDLERNGKK